jgi:hypothetical protein
MWSDFAYSILMERGDLPYFWPGGDGLSYQRSTTWAAVEAGL